MAALFIIIPLVAILCLNVPLGKVKFKLGFVLALVLTLGQALLTLFGSKTWWLSLRETGAWFSQFNLTVRDDLSVLMLLLIGIISFCGLLIAKATLKNDKLLFIFINLLLIAVTGMNGIVLVSDLFNFYVFLEITSVAAFILIALHREQNSLEGSFKYLILSALATLLMLSAIALLVLLSGEVSFASIRDTLFANRHSGLATVAVALFLCGLLIKAGYVPFNGWVPDAYAAAPAAVSVVLAGIITKASGLYFIMRLLTSVLPPSSGINYLLMLIGIISIFAGALAALGQHDFKRMLAYSSISQMGYIILSLGTGSALGLAGAVFHLFNHAIFKSQLFMNSAAVEAQTGTCDMDKLGGLTAKMPVTGFTAALACLSTAGIPPLAGFWSKLVIILALWQTGHYTFAALAILASIITLAYFLSLQRRVFFGQLAEGFEQLKEAGVALVLPAVLMTLITLGVGLAFPFIFDTLILPVKSLL